MDVRWSAYLLFCLLDCIFPPSATGDEKIPIMVGGMMAVKQVEKNVRFNQGSLITDLSEMTTAVKIPIYTETFIYF